MSAELDISYLPRSQSWVKLGLAGNPASGNKAKPSQPVVKAEGSDILAPWGDNNLYPQDIFNLARKNDLIPSTIDIQVALLVAAGYVIGQVEQVNGQDVFTPRSNSEISTFLDNTDIYGYLARAGSDFYWYRNGFPEIIRSDDGSKIIGVRGQQAMFCRYSQHNTSGIIEHCLINADWANEDKKYTIKLPVLSKFFPVDDLRSRKGTNFIYPLSFPSPGATHYALAPWHASVESKRLELANAFPVFKLALMNNQMTVKYLIEIADKYWPWRFTDWDTKPELKEARVDQVKQDLEDYLTGNENAGKSLFVPARLDAHSNEMTSFIKITPIESKIKDGVLIDDGQDTTSYLLFSLGLPAALMGNTPGKGGMGAGSGSDVREHLNLYMLKCELHKHMILEVFNRVVFPYNGWHGWQIRLPRPEMQTLDKISPAKREVA